MRLAWIATVLAGSMFGQTAAEKQRAAVALQQASVRRQAESVGIAALGTRPRNFLSPECDAVPEQVVAPLIEGAAKAQKLQPKLLRAVIERESAYRPCAVSPVGAQGLMQLMPATADELGVDDPFDPGQNIDAGARYLKQLLDKYKGDMELALAAYNAGPGTVDRAGGTPAIAETQDYVKAIVGKLGSAPKDPPEIQMPKPLEP